MAFTFGMPTFGANNGAFGAAASAPASPFGATSTPAFGASQPASNPFGAQQPAFGTQASTPSVFGAPSTPSAFGASASNPFGGNNPAANAFGNQSVFGQSTPASPFGGTQQSPSLFGQSAAGFGTPGQYGAIVPFQGQLGQQQQQQQQQFRQPAVNLQMLRTADGQWAAHSTKWGEIHPEGQKELRRMEYAL